MLGFAISLNLRRLGSMKESVANFLTAGLLLKSIRVRILNSLRK